MLFCRYSPWKKYFECNLFRTFVVAGEIISALRDTGLLGKTIIIFTADHGELAMEHRQFYKMSMYEGSSHVPLLVMGPGVREQQQIPNVVSLVDIYPTMLGELSNLGDSFFPCNHYYSAFVS